jgi:hypothetical protein
MLSGGIIKHTKEIKMFYVYQHLTKDTNTIFYVGKGKGNRCNTSKGRNRVWHRIVNKYNGFTVQKVVENIDEEFSFLVEMETIDIYKKRGLFLSNMTDGGEGTSGFSHPHSEEHKERLKGNKYGASTWGITFKGKTHSEEQKAKWSHMRKGTPSPRKGVKLTDETKEKISIARTGKPVLSRRSLTSEQVLEIRQKLGYRNIAMLAREYKVGESTIRRVRDGERYGDVS